MQGGGCFDPHRPYQNFLQFNEIKTLGGNKGALSHLRSQYEANDFAVRLAFALLHGLAVDVHRRSIPSFPTYKTDKDLWYS